MAPGFRYHIVTIAAIFFALGIGIVIGSSFVQSAIVSRQTRAVTALRQQFSDEVAAGREDLRLYGEFLTALSRQLDDRLKGDRIAIIQSGDYPEAVASAREALERAGASITSVTTLDSGFLGRGRANLPAMLPRLRETIPALPDDESSLLQVVARAVTQTDGGDALAVLERERLLRRDGDYAQIPEHVLVVAGATNRYMDRSATLDLPLVRALLALNAKVIACEPRKAEISSMPAFREVEITTVDNVDTDMGRIALVLAVDGPKGSYGVKPTAAGGPLPPSLTDGLRRHSGL